MTNASYKTLELKFSLENMNWILGEYSILILISSVLGSFESKLNPYICGFTKVCPFLRLGLTWKN